MLWATLSDSERAALGALLESRVALALMAWLFTSVLLALAAQRLLRDYVEAFARLEEETQVLLSQPNPHQLVGAGSAQARALARAINSLVSQRSLLQEDMERKVRGQPAG